VTADLSGTGLAPAVLSIAPVTKDYGVLVIGTSASADFQISNAGGQMTGVPSAAALIGNDINQFVVIGSTCTAALASGARCTVTVRFSPTTAGAKATQLTLMATPGGTVTTNLAGSGVTPGALTITPLNAAFNPPLLPGTTSAVSMFTVTNTSGAATGALSTT